MSSGVMSIPFNVVKALWDNVMEAMRLLRSIAKNSFALLILPVTATRDLVAGLLTTIYQSLAAISNIFGRKKIVGSDAKVSTNDEKSNFD